MYFLAAGWKPFNILYITKCLTYNISRKQISIARYYIYRMKAAVLIIFILVAQVFADFHSIGFDSVDPEAISVSDTWINTLSCSCEFLVGSTRNILVPPEIIIDL